MTNFSDSLTIFLILSGFAMWGSIILCGIIVILSIRNARKAPDELNKRKYQDLDEITMGITDKNPDAVDNETNF